MLNTETESRTQEPAAATDAPEAAAESAPEAPPVATSGATVADESKQLEDRIRSGARWFHWVAGLSVINSIIVVAGGSWSFLFGLGVTQFVDGIVLLAIEEDPGAALMAKVLGVGINLTIAGGYVLLGWLAGRRHTWAFAVGMVFYALDGMIFLVFRDFLGLAFHAWVLFGLFVGLKACYRRGRMQQD